MSTGEAQADVGGATNGKRAERGGLFSRLGVDKLRRPPKPEVHDPIAAAKWDPRQQAEAEMKGWAESFKTSETPDDFVPERLRGPNTVGLRPTPPWADEEERQG